MINPLKPFNAEPSNPSNSEDPIKCKSNKLTNILHHVWLRITQARLTGSAPFTLRVRVRVRQRWRQIHADRLTAQRCGADAQCSALKPETAFKNKAPGGTRNAVMINNRNTTILGRS